MAGVQLTVLQSCNVTGNWVDYRCLGAGDLAPPNTPPQFTNIPADGVPCVADNTRLVIDLNATDADGYVLGDKTVGGADAGAFTVNGTARATFNGTAGEYDLTLRHYTTGRNRARRW